MFGSPLTSAIGSTPKAGVPRSGQRVIRGAYMLTGLPADYAVVQLTLVEIADFLTGSLSTTTLDGEGETWTVEGNHVASRVTLTFSPATLHKAPLLFEGTIEETGLVVGELRSGKPAVRAPSKLFPTSWLRQRGAAAGLAGGWALQGLPAPWQQGGAILQEIGDLIVGSFSAAVQGQPMDFNVQGNDFRPVDNKVHLLFQGPTRRSGFAFDGELRDRGFWVGTLTGALSGRAALVPASAAEEATLVQGLWMISGLPAEVTVVFFLLSQVLDTLTGTLEIAVDGQPTTFDAKGTFTARAEETFQMDLELSAQDGRSFGFSGVFSPNEGRAKGALTGLWQREAEIFPVST